MGVREFARTHGVSTNHIMTILGRYNSNPTMATIAGDRLNSIFSRVELRITSNINGDEYVCVLKGDNNDYPEYNGKVKYKSPVIHPDTGQVLSYAEYER